jgi:peroxiredoxin
VELRDRYGEFQALGAEVVALAVAPLEAVEGVRASIGAPFPMLADPDRRAAEAYGVYNLFGDGLAAPAVFVLKDGVICWSYVGQNPTDRPPLAEILARVQDSSRATGHLPDLRYNNSDRSRLNGRLP